jgi:hypothetical protein
MEDTQNTVKWAVPSHVRATYSEDGAVLLDINKGIVYSLDAVAARLWVTIEACQSGITLDGIVGAVETDFEAPRRELEGDTIEWLNKLQRLGLLYSNGRAMSSKNARRGT